MSGKFSRGISISILAILLLATVAVPRVGALPPEELNLTVDRVYAVPSSLTTFGTWSSTGVLVSSGGIYESYFFAGWNEAGWFVKNAHQTITLSDANGTITIKAQLQEADFEPFGPAEFAGSWVIVDGAGDYARLRGQGNVTVSEVFHWSCPANAYGVTGPCVVGTETYTGRGHFHP